MIIIYILVRITRLKRCSHTCYNNSIIIYSRVIYKAWVEGSVSIRSLCNLELICSFCQECDLIKQSGGIL